MTSQEIIDALQPHNRQPIPIPPALRREVLAAACVYISTGKRTYFWNIERRRKYAKVIEERVSHNIACRISS